MIVRSLTVQGWRCFASEARVGPFSDGLTVVHAPNGTGKSTLFEALRRALLDAHTTSGRAVETLRPWGRALAPTVTVTFAHEGVEYQLHKRFLDRPVCELSRREGGVFVPLAQGVRAEETVRALLSASPPERGLSRAEHAGLAQVLWAPQGELALAPLAGPLAEQLRRSLSAQLTGPAGAPLERAIEARYREFFAPVTGKLRQGRGAPAVVQLEQELTRARAALHEAHGAHEAYGAAAGRVEALRSAAAEAERAATALAERFEAARARAARAAEAHSGRAEAAAEASSAQSRFEALRQQIEVLAHARSELVARRSARESLAAEIPARAREAQARASALEAARERVEQLRQTRRAHAARAQELTAAREFHALRAARDGAERRASQAAAAARAHTAADEARAALHSPDANAVRAARDAERALSAASARVDAAAVVLQLDAGAAGAEAAGAGEALRALAPGESLAVRGDPDATLVLAAAGTVRAWSALGDPSALRAARDAAAAALARELEPYGALDLPALEALSRRGEALSRAAHDASVHLRALLRGEALDAVLRAPAALVAELERRAAAHPQWAGAAPEPASLAAELAREAQAAEALEAAAERASEEAARALAQTREERRGAEGRIEELDRQLRGLEARLADLLADGADDASRTRALGEAALAHHGALARLAALDAALHALGPAAADEVKQLEAALTAARARARKALGDEKLAEGELAHLAARGTYSALVRAQEECERLEADARREHQRAEAMRLLYTTVQTRRQAAIAAVAGPVEIAATRALHEVAGDALGAVQFGERFEPASVRPAAAGGAAVALDGLSGGEREQVYLAARLALAEVLAGESRQLVVLDDVLTATDSARFARVLALLARAAERLQVVLLTCHPERYAPLLGTAQFLDLTAATRAAAERAVGG